MTYSYSAPLSYEAGQPLAYYENVRTSKKIVTKKPGKNTSAAASSPASATACTAGATLGAITGAVIGLTKRPYTQNGVPTDTFAYLTYEKYAKRAADAEKQSYKQFNEVLQRLDKVNTPEELKALLEKNPEAYKEVSSSLNRFGDSFLGKILNRNLKANKRAIRKKLEAANGMRYQNMKNEIDRAWNEEMQKFVKPEDMEKDVFRAIKSSARKIKAGFAAKYAAIAAVIGGAGAYLVHRIVTNKKHKPQELKY